MAVKADITIDIDKQVGELQNLTQIYNARVGDNKTPLTIAWRKNDLPLNLKGLHAYIVGKTGDGSYNSETGKIDFPVNTPVSQFEDDGSGTLDGGQSGLTTLLIPKQMWQNSGLFAGYIGLKSEDGSVFTSKDIWFKVLGNVLDAGVEINYFIGDFDKALADAEKKLQDKTNSFDQATANALQDLHDKYLQKAQEAEDTLGDTQASIDANIASLKTLAAEIASIQIKIETEDLITKSQYDSDRKYIVNLVETQLANLSNSIEYLPSAQAIKDKYPNGEKVFAVAADTGHKWIYYNGSWQDCGAYDGKDFDNNVLAGYGILFWDDKHTPEKYQDLNTLAVNRIYGYSQFVPKNAPTDSFNGFVIDQSYQSTGIELQIAVDINSHNVFFRTNWGGTNAWPTEWDCLSNSEKTLSSSGILFYDEQHTPEKYQDLNTLDINRIYGYSGFTPKNVPVDNFNGIVLTFGFDPSQKQLVTQIAHAENLPVDGKNNFVDQWYERHSWGSSNLNFSSWKRIDAFNGLKSFGQLFFDSESCPEEYKDLNSLPQNTIFGYDAVRDLKNSVPGLNFNGLVYNLSYSQEKGQSFIQYAICKDDYGPIVAYRNNWSSKLSPWIVENKSVDFYVNAKNQATDSQHFTKLIDAMWATQKTQHPVTIHVAAGTYDMYQEFGGEDYLKKLDLHTNADDFKTEMPMLSNVTIIGEGNVKLNYMPDLNVAEKYPHAANIISPINVAGKFSMKNVEIEVQYGRYCIHDETSGDSANFYKSHTYSNVNCIYHRSLADSIGGQAFGGGFDNGQSYLFQNCKFSSEVKAGLSFHNRESCGGNFIFDNCAFSGKDWSVRFGNVGKQDKTKVNFSNCYFAQKIYVNVEASTIESNNSYALTLNNCNQTAIEFDSNLKSQPYVPKVYNALGVANN